MNNENKTIHKFDFNLICEYFSNVERQGPGSPEATLKALGFIDGLTPQSRIADLGCGTGGQTLTLAQNAPGQVTGLDLSSAFIDIFNRNVRSLGLSDRVKGIVGAMDDLPFEHESLDLIWSEGAIYNIGFERGLTEWRAYLKADGHVAVTECSWLTAERPDEIRNFWMLHYPAIETIAKNVARMQRAGYAPVAAFVLPESCWTEHYFAPCRRMQETFLKKHAGSRAAEDLIADQCLEMEMYRRYKNYYGYVFYIGRKV